MALLAVDVGGSGSRALLRDERTQAASGAPVRITGGRLDIDDALDSLAARFPDAPGEFEVVAVGMASLVAFGDPDALAERIRRHWPCRRLILASDGVTALASVWGTGGGAVVAAGTGVVGLATDFAGRWHRVDGWGYHLGDAGSGAWIGSRGVRAALRALDGRADGSPVLLRAAESMFGAASGFAAVIADSPSPARSLAGFVPAVVEAADDGDAVADGILSAAAGELAETAAALVDGGLRARVALVGGLSGIDSLARRFEERLHRLVPEALTVCGGSEPVQGALALAESAAAGGPLESHPPYLYLDNPV